jgi:hypothetical protein
MQMEEYPVNTPTSTAFFAPMSRTSIVRNSPSSCEICIVVPGTAAWVSSTRSRRISSAGVQWARR